MRSDKKRSILAVKQVQYIDYKNVEFLKSHTQYHGKIKPRRYTGHSVRHQKMLSKAIKNARIMGLLPFIA
ncbi:MAG: 30S ribosomal protein S18 [Patescibacteria group bacterium]|nr:30S ribosomal protein S18 [Patescibacteria group bacterium]